MAELQRLRNYYANCADPCAALITAGTVGLTCQHLLTRYARNRSLLSQPMLLMLLTVTIIASPSLPHFSLSHPPSLFASVWLETILPEAQAFGGRHLLEQQQHVEKRPSRARASAFSPHLSFESV